MIAYLSISAHVRWILFSEFIYMYSPFSKLKADFTAGISGISIITLVLTLQYPQHT